MAKQAEIAPTQASGIDDAATLSVLISEKAGLDKEIGDLKRSSAVVITSSYVVFTAASLAIAQATTRTLDTTRVVLSLLPVVLTLITIPYMNQSIEVAALAEQRDRLGGQINRRLRTDVALARYVSGARAGAPGALAANLAFGLVYVSSLGLGLWAASTSDHRWWLWVQIAGTLLAAVFSIATVKDFLSVRWKVNERLDQLLTPIDRPIDAAPRKAPLSDRIRIDYKKQRP